MKKLLFILLITLITANLSLASSIEPDSQVLNPPMVLEPIIATQTIQVDGALEDFWFSSTQFSNFAEFQPNYNVPANVPTEGYVTLDDKNLYVAFICYDPEIANLRASITDRDHIYQDDFVGVVIDTYGDKQRAYEFFANPRGIQGDMLWNANRAEDDGNGAIWQANGAEDASFDAMWESEAKVYEDRWVVEMKIPFSSIRYPNKEDQNWAVHFIRSFPRENRYQYSWMPISQDNNSFMGQAGGLKFKFAETDNSSRSLQFMPYVAATKSRMLLNDGTGNGKWTNLDDGKLKLSDREGFTSKFILSTNNVVDVTYKPDFSQIESDGGRVNVNSPFAFFYGERRPFFMEGSDIFQVDFTTSGMILDVANLIYTRSINDPEVAGKVTGKMGRVSYGYIAANDKSTPLILPLADGTIVRNTGEDSWSNIMRVKVDLGNQSNVGFTATNRSLDLGGSNTAVAMETSLRLSKDYTFNAFGAMTYTDEADNEEISQIIPDMEFKVGDEMITTDFDGQDFYGHVFKTTLLRQSQNWNFNISYQDYSPGFRADNSAVFSNDGRLLHTQQAYNFRFEDNALYTQIRPSLYLWRKVDYKGDVKDTGIRPQLLFAFKHQTSFNVGGFLYNREKYREVKFGDARTIWFNLSSNAFQKVSGGVFLNVGNTINRFGVVNSAHNPFEIVPNIDFNVSITLRPSEKINNNIEYNSTSLWTNKDKDLIVRQEIIRNGLQYNFSKKLFVRMIGELNMVKMATAPHKYQNSTYFSLEPMLSMKLNPFTVLYVGANFGGEKDPYLNYDGMNFTDQTAYVKFQYLWNVF